MLRVRALTDAAKNAAVEVVVRGEASKPTKANPEGKSADLDWTVVVDLSKLNHAPKRARIDEIYYALSEKVEVQIAWHHPNEERLELLPLSGRGRLGFPAAAPTASAGDHTGNIEIRTIGLQPGQLVYLLFDLTKQ